MAVTVWFGSTVFVLRFVIHTSKLTAPGIADHVIVGVISCVGVGVVTIVGAVLVRFSV